MSSHQTLPTSNLSSDSGSSSGNKAPPSKSTIALNQEHKSSPELSSTAKKVTPGRRSRQANESSPPAPQQQQQEQQEQQMQSPTQREHETTGGQGQGLYSDYNRVYTLSPPERRDYSVFPSTPQYDPTLLDISEPLSPFFRTSPPRVTPSRYYIPSAGSLALAAAATTTTTGISRTSLPPPKYSMKDDSIRQDVAAAEDNMSPSGAVAFAVGGGSGSGSVTRRPTGAGDGLDQIIRASESTDYEYHPAMGRVVKITKETVRGQEQVGQDDDGDNNDGEEDKDNSSPPRESILRNNGKVVVVSPPEGDVPRKGTMANSSGYDLPNVPDSPYGPPGVYPPYHHGSSPYYPHAATGIPPPAHGYPYPPSFHRNATHMADGIEAMAHDRYRQYYYGVPPYGYGYDVAPGSSSLGKRKRMQDPHPLQPQDDREHEMEQEGSGEDYGSVLPRPYYYDRDRQSYRYYRPPVSESFESSSDSGSKQRRTRAGAPPAISKAPTYPPPPSPNRYGMQGADSSAATYPPGARSHPSSRLVPGGPASSYGNVGRYHPPTRYEDNQGYPFPPQELYSRPSRGGGGGYVEGGGVTYGYPSGQPSSPVPKHSHHVQSEDMHASPMSSKQKLGSNATVSSPKEISSPSKAKASTNAQAAIAAGMTEPSSAKEVDFDITAPPTEPITPPSNDPICTSCSELKEDDVLCGRGGGTNTQIGNRRFRSLVQEFQPTYLLCRRKEKPQIARTIVLIIRKRGGRFLKKNEDDGTYFEVGDEKAEAKTCQALREGLDVRATKSTIDGRKKSGRARSNNKKKESVLPDGRGADAVHVETESPRRDGPPPAPYYEVFPYAPPPPPYYYGPYDPYYSPPFDLATSPHSSSYTPRKRVARFLPSSGDAPYSGEYHGYHHAPTPYKHHHGYQYMPEQRPPQQRELIQEEANAMTWEMEFSPPRSGIVKK
mmetsp:Transcript_1699/g.3101  ORF Transcript_1699/g.3101 Transcript_1699/m.3101 type:complete len:941 (+) Transcript_1699:457-3279(+)